MALEKFCFCCKLHNGTFIWGVLSIIFHAIVLIITVSSDLFVKRNLTTYIDTISYLDNYSYSPMYWVFVFGSTIDLIVSILLVVGVLKRNHYMMLPWIIVNAIVLIPLVLLACLCLIVTVPIYGPIYIWWCICSAYQKVQEVPEMPFTSVLTVSESYPYPKPDEDA